MSSAEAIQVVHQMMDASAAVSVILGSSQLGTPPKRAGPR